jgi:hypothetical protein
MIAETTAPKSQRAERQRDRQPNRGDDHVALHQEVLESLKGLHLGGSFGLGVAPDMKPFQAPPPIATNENDPPEGGP